MENFRKKLQRMTAVFMSAVIAAGTLGTAVYAEEETEEPEAAETIEAETEEPAAETETAEAEEEAAAEVAADTETEEAEITGETAVQEETEQEPAEEEEPVVTEAVQEEEEFKEAQTYNLYVGGEQVTDDNKNDILNDGTASYDPATNTLTLNDLDGVSGMTMSTLIYAEEMDLRIEGSGKIYSAGDFTKLNGIEVWDGSLTLAGDFEVTSDSIGIYVNTGDMTLESGTVKVTSGSDGLHVHNGVLTICEGIDRLESYAAEDGASDAVYGQNGITIADKLFIEAPEGGRVNDEHVVNADGSRATHVVIIPGTRYTVSYDANGGSGEMASELVYAGEEYTLPVCEFTEPEFMEFKGWQSDDGSTYAEGEPVEITGNTTFKALWKETFNVEVLGTKVTLENKDDILSDGGSAKYDAGSATLTLNGTFTTTSDVMDGVFAETNINIDGNAVINVTGDHGIGINLPYNEVYLNGDITVNGTVFGVYAKVILVEKGSLVVNAEKGDAIHSFRGDIIIGKNAELVDATGLNYALQAISGEIVIDETLTVTEPEDGDLSARHVVIGPAPRYTVSYDANGGTGTMENDTVIAGKPYELPDCAFTAPEDMKFDGWKAENGQTYQPGDPYDVTGDITFTAQWKDKYELYVGGVKVTKENKNDILGDGKASFDSETNTLTLTGVDGMPDSYLEYLIYANGMDLRIEGNGHIYLHDGTTISAGVRVDEGNLTLAGNFDISGDVYGVYVGGGNMTLESGTIKATAREYDALHVFKGTLNIGEGMTRLVAEAGDIALYGHDGITIDSSLYMETPAGGYVDELGKLLNADGSRAQEAVIIKPTEPVFSGHQLILTGSLGLRFGMKFPEGFDSTGSYMTFKVSGETQTMNTADAETASGLTIYTCTLNTLQMAEEIEAVFHYGDQEVVQTYSLTDYFTYFDDNPSKFDAQTLNLVKAVADYGYFAQPYLVSVNSLEGKYAPITKHYAESYDFEAIKEVVTEYAFAKAISDSAVTNASYKLSLDSDTALTVLMQVPAGTELTASAVFGGKTYTAEKLSDTVYAVKITGIKASRLGDTITVNGSAEGDFTITVSALSYVRTVLNGSGYEDDAKNAVASLYSYYHAIAAR